MGTPAPPQWTGFNVLFHTEQTLEAGSKKMTLWGLSVSQRNTPTAHTLASVPGDQCPEPCLIELDTQHSKVQLHPHGSFIRKLRDTLRHRACSLQPFLTDFTQVLWKCLPRLLRWGAQRGTTEPPYLPAYHLVFGFLGPAISKRGGSVYPLSHSRKTPQ